MNSITKKAAITTFAILALTLTALGASATDANAGGWGKKKFHLYIHNHHRHHYGYAYRCTPKFKRIWIWSPRHGRNIKRLVKVGKWCGGRYYNIY